jgi:hypothetical protein
VKSRMTQLGVAAAVLIVSGCAGHSDVAVQPAGPPTSTPAAKVRPVSNPSSAPPSKKGSEDSTGAEDAFCHGVLKDSRPAMSALRELAKHPDGSTVSKADFSVPRDRLQRRVAGAPDHLVGYLKTQVSVLDDVASDVTSVRHPTRLANRFGDARMEFVLDCEMAE